MSTTITPGLAVAAGHAFPELHILDGGGRPQLILEVPPESLRDLIDALTFLEEVYKVPETIDVEPTVIQLELQPEAPAEDPAEGPEAPEPIEPVLSQSTDWASLTKAEIVAQVQERFGVDLDIHDLKDDLIAQAVETEATFHA